MENSFSGQLPPKALPVDPQELADAFTLIVRVFSGEDPFDPTRYRMNVVNDRGEVESLNFVDTPLNRIILALQEWCREETTEKYLSLCWRLFALNELIHQGTLGEWVRPDATRGYLSIPGAVLEVASTLPLEKGRGFEPRVFIQAVRKLVF